MQRYGFETRSPVLKEDIGEQTFERNITGMEKNT
jgi:hypothetical protein